MMLRSSLFSTLLALAWLTAWSWWAPAGAGAETSGEAGAAGRPCGTPGSVPPETAERAIRAWTEEFGGSRSRSPRIVPVRFHVITSGAQGQVTDGQVARQIAGLDRAFRGTGYSFELAGVDRADRDDWFRMAAGSEEERRAKQALAVSPTRHLNVYSCGPQAGLAGWTYYPWRLPEDRFLDGVAIHHAMLSEAPPSRSEPGSALAHQVAHYLGLGVAPGGACAGGPGAAGLTSAEIDRLDAAVTLFRPGLLPAGSERADSHAEIELESASPADLTRAFEFRGAAPNPFRSETAIRFTIPSSERVTLEVYSVTGQLARTLIDATLPAGLHGAMLSSRGLAAGLYFVSLRVGSATMTRSVVLLP